MFRRTPTSTDPADPSADPSADLPAERSVPPAPQDPLGPLESVVKVVCVILVGGLLVGTLASLFLDRFRTPFVSGGLLCATGSSGVSGDPVDALFDAPPGTQVVVDGARHCLQDPSTAQEAWHALREAVSFLWLAGSFVWTYFVLRRARRRGPFTEPTVRALHGLGWFLSLGAVAAHVVEAVANSMLMRDLAGSADPGGHIAPDTWPWFALFAGIGLIAFARLMRRAVQMREDLEGVV